MWGDAGRADYYGALPNLAARVSALAAPGQVLIEGSGGWSGELDRGLAVDHSIHSSRPSQAGWLPIARTLSKTPTDEEPIELEEQGYFLLKVTDHDRLCSVSLATSCLKQHTTPSKKTGWGWRGRGGGGELSTVQDKRRAVSSRDAVQHSMALTSHHRKWW